MQDPYACAICWKRLTQPIVLNCGHTFDRNCVDSVESCPICQADILSRTTNWQLISILESQVELDDHYVLIEDWKQIDHGTWIKYTLNAKKSSVHHGWFASFDSEQQIVHIQLQHGRSVRLPLKYVKEAWYHLDLIRTPERREAHCCTLL